MLKFLIDESSGKKLAIFLSQKGYDVKYVGNFMPSSSDKEVLDFAEKENRILITNDKDFGELIFRLSKPSSGVILLRLKDESVNNKQKYILQVINKFSNKINKSFLVVTEKKVRIKNL